MGTHTLNTWACSVKNIMIIKIIVCIILVSFIPHMIGGEYNSGHEHQERNNWMVPDFQPFKHPSKNIDSIGPLSSKSGPIADVEWVEEVMPVFGKITKVQKQEKDTQGGSTTLLIGLIVGGIVAAILYKSKGNIKEEKESKSSKNIDQQKGTNEQVTVDNIIINVKRVVPPEVKTQKQKEKDYEQDVPVNVIKKDEKTEPAIKLDQVQSVSI